MKCFIGYILVYYVYIKLCLSESGLQDFQDKKSRPVNQEINGMNACRRSPKSTVWMPLAECAFGILH